jgi:hypothetical protein
LWSKHIYNTCNFHIVMQFVINYYLHKIQKAE